MNAYVTPLKEREGRAEERERRESEGEAIGEEEITDCDAEEREGVWPTAAGKRREGRTESDPWSELLSIRPRYNTIKKAPPTGFGTRLAVTDQQTRLSVRPPSARRPPEE